jgi:hypothetical protein
VTGATGRRARPAAQDRRIEQHGVLAQHGPYPVRDEIDRGAPPSSSPDGLAARMVVTAIEAVQAARSNRRVRNSADQIDGQFGRLMRTRSNRISASSADSIRFDP